MALDDPFNTSDTFPRANEKPQVAPGIGDQIRTWQQTRVAQDGHSLAHERSLRVEEGLANLVNDWARHVFNVADLRNLPSARPLGRQPCASTGKTALNGIDTGEHGASRQWRTCCCAPVCSTYFKSININLKSVTQFPPRYVATLNAAHALQATLSLW